MKEVITILGGAIIFIILLFVAIIVIINVIDAILTSIDNVIKKHKRKADDNRRN